MHADVAKDDSAMGALGEGRLGAAAWLSAVLLLATIGALGLMVITPLSVAGCGDLCNYDTLTVALRTFYVLAALPLIIAIAGSYLLRERGWWVLLAPLTGFLVLGLLFAITYSIARAAMLL